MYCTTELVIVLFLMLIVLMFWVTILEYRAQELEQQLIVLTQRMMRHLQNARTVQNIGHAHHYYPQERNRE